MENAIKSLYKHNNNARSGFFKKWLLVNKKSDLYSDILQKIAYSIVDLNEEINNYKYSRKSIVYQIVLSCWISEAIVVLQKQYKTEVIKSFTYNTKYFEKSKKYLSALRSFVIAHPLDTSRHGEYGFDGDLICVDISSPSNMTVPLMKKDRISRLDLEGKKQWNKRYKNPDYYLHVYSENKDNSKCFEYIGCYLKDIYKAVNVLISYLRSFNSFLSKQKKQDYDLLIR